MRTESIPTPTGQRIEKLSEAEEKTFDLLVTEHEEASIDMNEFGDIPRYAERLDRDKASVERKKAAIKKKAPNPPKRPVFLRQFLPNKLS